jgi:hypothetical protein
MSATKRRYVGLMAATALGVAVFAAVTGMGQLWYIVLGLSVGAALRALTPMHDDRRPNYPVKAAQLVLIACFAAGCIVWGAGHDWRWAAIGTVLLLPTVAGLWLVAHERSPWWL